MRLNDIGGKLSEGYRVVPGFDKDKYQERQGLEGPFSTKSGKVVYYDKVEGKYYDPDTDMYIEYDDWQAMNEQGVAEGFFGIDDKIKGKIQNLVSRLSDEYGMWDHKAQTFTPQGLETLKSMLKFNERYIKYALSLTHKDYEAEGVAEGAFDNYSPMAKDTIKQDKIRSLENLIAIYKKEGRQLRVQELERELSSLKNVSEGPFHNPGQEDSPVAQAITRRILLQRTDLLAKYGPEKVGQAIDEVADFVGDVDEIGSSDVSGWIRHVEQMLGNMGESQFESEGAPKSALGKALWRDLSKFKKASPAQQQRNKERWAANPHNPINKAK